MNDNSDSGNSNAGYADTNSIELDPDLAHMLRSLPPIDPSVDFARGIESRFRNLAQQKIGKGREFVKGDMPSRDMLGHRIPGHYLPSRKIYSAIKAWTEDYTRPWAFGLALNGTLLVFLTFFGNNTDTSLSHRATTLQPGLYGSATSSELDTSDTLLSLSDANRNNSGNYSGESEGESSDIETIETFWEDYLPTEEV